VQAKEPANAGLPLVALVSLTAQGSIDGAGRHQGGLSDASPGETNDQLFVWYPDAKVLFAGDNFYRSFPNLYAIRGTPNRNIQCGTDEQASPPNLAVKLPENRNVF
jgi:hypothetical protein